MAQSILGSSPVYKTKFPSYSAPTSTISGSKLKFLEIEKTHLGFLNSPKFNLPLRLKASRAEVGLVEETKETTLKFINNSNDCSDPFSEMKNRFLSFKKHKYLENLECYQELAKAQAPKIHEFAPLIFWAFNLVKLLLSAM